MKHCISDIKITSFWETYNTHSKNRWDIKKKMETVYCQFKNAYVSKSAMYWFNPTTRDIYKAVILLFKSS